MGVCRQWVWFLSYGGGRIPVNKRWELGSLLHLLKAPLLMFVSSKPPMSNFKVVVFFFLGHYLWSIWEANSDKSPIVWAAPLYRKKISDVYNILPGRVWTCCGQSKGQTSAMFFRCVKRTFSHHASPVRIPSPRLTARPCTPESLLLSGPLPQSLIWLTFLL